MVLDNLSLNDKEEDEEYSLDEEACRNLPDKKLTKVLVKKNYDEYEDSLEIDLTRLGGLSECRMCKLMGPVLKEAQKECRTRKKKNMTKKQ